MAPQYDSAAKFIAHEYTQTFVEFAFGFSGINVLERLDTEQTTLRTHRNDSTIKVQLSDETAILHVEVQSYSSKKPMPYRIAGYQGFLISEHQIPVYSCVVYLHPQAGRNDPGYYAYEGHSCRYVIQYKVIRLIQIEGQPILENQILGLLPLAPLMKPPDRMDANRWLEACVEATVTSKVDAASCNNLLAALGIFSSLVYDPQLIEQILPEGTMQESPIIQHYMEVAKAQGIEQGEKKAIIESIIILLSTRFPLELEGVQNIKLQLEEIDDLQHLKKLNLSTYNTQTLEAFIQQLPK